MTRLIAGFVAVLFVAPAAVSAQTTRPADQRARDINADRPVWRNGVGLYEAEDIIGTRIKNAAGKDLGEVDQLHEVARRTEDDEPADHGVGTNWVQNGL